jgi:hypothetical protein
VRSIFASLFAACLLYAQYPPGQYPPQYPPGQYPPGQYPPNQYPTRLPGGVPVSVPIPEIKLPRRAPKDPDAKKQGGKPTSEIKIALQSVEGSLRQFEEKSMQLDTTAKGTLQFRLLAKTQFIDKEGRPIRDSLLKPGDQLQVSYNPDDEETALRVMFLRAATTTEKESVSSPPAPKEDKGADAPILRRGLPDRVAQEQPAPPPASSDPIIAAAREAAGAFTDTLPDFLVQQHTMRYTSSTVPPNWQAIDIVTAEVAVSNGKEEYRKISINGRETKRPVEKTGSWSTGEFSTTLDDILSPFTAAAFVKKGEQRTANRDTFVYDYSVLQPNSHWSVIPNDKKAYNPPFKGTIWIDKQTKRVLRIEQRAVSFPDDFEFDRAEVTLDYDFVLINGKQYLMPVHSENVICIRGTTTCSRNELNFRNYRKFTAESGIVFEKQ